MKISERWDSYVRVHTQESSAEHNLERWTPWTIFLSVVCSGAAPLILMAYAFWQFHTAGVFLQMSELNTGLFSREPRQCLSGSDSPACAHLLPDILMQSHLPLHKVIWEYSPRKRNFLNSREQHAWYISQNLPWTKCRRLHCPSPSTLSHSGGADQETGTNNTDTILMLVDKTRADKGMVGRKVTMNQWAEFSLQSGKFLVHCFPQISLLSTCPLATVT